MLWIVLYISLFFISQQYLKGEDQNNLKNNINIDTYTIFKRNFNKDKNCIGDLNKTLTSIKIKEKHGFQGGLSLLKNAGENFTFDIKTHRFLFSTFSFYTALEDKKIKELTIKKIIIGNFKIGYGQGLVFNYINDKFSKPVDCMNIFREQHGIKNTLTQKKHKFLGIGTTLQFKNIETTLFGSVNFIDADIKNNIAYSPNIREKYTCNENIQKKDKLKSYSFGGTFLYNPKKLFEVGINSACTIFDKPLKLIKKKENDKITNDTIYGIKKQNYNVGIFSSLKTKKFNLYFEYARSFQELKNIVSIKNAGYASIFGAKIDICANLKNVTLFRVFSTEYKNFYGKAFSCGYGNFYKEMKGCSKNEIGLYNCFQIIPANQIDFKIAFDIFFNPEQTLYSKKQIGKICEFECRGILGQSQHALFRCKYSNLKKIKELKNTKSLRTKIEIKKRIKEITNKTQFLTSTNLEAKKTSICINEKISLYIKKVSASLIFTFSNAQKESAIYLFKKDIEKDNKRIEKLSTRFIQTSINISYKWINGIKIEGFYSFRYDMTNTKNKFKNVIKTSLSYSK